MIEDFDLVVASFTSQYGLRIADIKKMSWQEFKTLLIGISPDTILGRMVSIRAEDDPEIIKHFSQEQKKIRNEWRSKRAKMMKPADVEQAMLGFERIFLSMVGVNYDA
ncbi:MAG: bacteriophage Gp15 family protein [Eubacterium sp.]|nr:bacteriophage Gp15 family protein [Eubacterium sp.]